MSVYKLFGTWRLLYTFRCLQCSKGVSIIERQAYRRAVLHFEAHSLSSCEHQKQSNHAETDRTLIKMFRRRLLKRLLKDKYDDGGAREDDRG
jgi:hypothetical protein